MQLQTIFCLLAVSYVFPRTFAATQHPFVEGDISDPAFSRSTRSTTLDASSAGAPPSDADFVDDDLDMEDPKNQPKRPATPSASQPAAGTRSKRAPRQPEINRTPLDMGVIISSANKVLTREQFVLPAQSTLYVRDIHYSPIADLTHVYLRPRTPSGVEIANFQLHMNFRFSELISFTFSGIPGLMPGSIFRNVIGKDISEPAPRPAGYSWASTNAEALIQAPALITPVEAVVALANHLHIPDVRAINLTPVPSSRTLTTIHNTTFTANGFVNITTSLYFDRTGALTRTHNVLFYLEGNYLSAHISADDGAVLSLVDWVYSAGKFLVYGWGGPNDAGEGAPTLRSEDARGIAAFSPHSWVTLEKKARWNIAGNNADVRDGRPNALDTDLGPIVPGFEDGVMAYTPGSLNFGITNVFFLVNNLHDLLATYGFDVRNGAFQLKSYIGNGREGGSVVVYVDSDIATRENPDIARFWAPPSPEPGVMELGVLQGRSVGQTFDVPVHEYIHGLTSRSTGGSTNANCLCGNKESEMLAEGWSDLFSVILRVTPRHTRLTAKFGFAEYITGKNLRGRKYSAAGDHKDTYTLTTGRSAHMGGVIWAAALYDMFWNLVDRYDFDPDWMSKSKDRGNTLALSIIMTAMRLQPCLPSFLNARDAIIQATQLIKPAALCDVWRAMANRGLGANAHVARGSAAEGEDAPMTAVDGRALPSSCRGSKAAPIRRGH